MRLSSAIDRTLEALRDVAPNRMRVVSGRIFRSTKTEKETGVSRWPHGVISIARASALAFGADGYRTVFALGELDPDFGNRPSIVAYAETLNGVSTLLASDGPFRVTAPGDVKGGRYVSNLVRLDVRASGSTVASVGGGVSTQFTVSGAVLRPGTYDLAALQALPVVTQTAGTSAYTGVSFWSFLNTAAGLKTNPAVKNDSLGMYAVATGSDGYKAVFSLGELDPGFGNQPDLIAYAQAGVPLTTTGFARIVVPNDVKAGRYVSNLISIEVFAAP